MLRGGEREREGEREGKRGREREREREGESWEIEPLPSAVSGRSVEQGHETKHQSPSLPRHVGLLSVSGRPTM